MLSGKIMPQCKFQVHVAFNHPNCPALASSSATVQAVRDGKFSPILQKNWFHNVGPPAQQCRDCRLKLADLNYSRKVVVMTSRWKFIGVTIDLSSPASQAVRCHCFG